MDYVSNVNLEDQSKVIKHLLQFPVSCLCNLGSCVFCHVWFYRFLVTLLRILTLELNVKIETELGFYFLLLLESL